MAIGNDITLDSFLSSDSLNSFLHLGHFERISYGVLESSPAEFRRKPFSTFTTSLRFIIHLTPALKRRCKRSLGGPC